MAQMKAQICVLASLVATVCLGCAPLHYLPDRCADAVYQCKVARAVHNICSSRPCPLDCGSSCGDCGIRVYDDVVVVDEGCCQDACPLLARIEPGPPPVPYEPPLPPKFLPVPTRSVFATSVLQTSAQVPPVEMIQQGPNLAAPHSF